jgi:hypothetical protein
MYRAPTLIGRHPGLFVEQVSQAGQAVVPSDGMAAVSPRVRVRAAVALGATLARRGPMAIASFVVSALTVVVLALLGLGFARRDDGAPVHDVPLLASSALAWGGGFLHAVAASSGAFARDRTVGIRQLFVTRTTSIRGYVVGRVGGLAAWLWIAVGGGTLAVSAITVLGATRPDAIPRTVEATIASLAFASAFALVLAPVAFATLGARSRGAGYLALLAVVVLPELVVEVLTGPLPSEVTELCALPSALAALRSSLAPNGFDLLRFVRALVALAVFSAVAMFFARRGAALLEREPEAGR